MRVNLFSLIFTSITNKINSVRQLLSSITERKPSKPGQAQISGPRPAHQLKSPSLSPADYCCKETGSWFAFLSASKYQQCLCS